LSDLSRLYPPSGQGILPHARRKAPFKAYAANLAFFEPFSIETSENGLAYKGRLHQIRPIL
jgi:hypothetical protein